MAYSTVRSAAASPPAPSDAEPKFLLELMVADLEWTSLQLALLALAAAGGAESNVNLRPLRHLVYADACVMRLALRYAGDVGLSRDAAGKLDRLYADLSAAMKPIAPLVESADPASWRREQLSRLLPGLRALANAASQALSALEPMMRAHLDPKYLHDSGVIREYLGRAASGELTPAERLGALEPPALKQRRQNPRAAINRPCRIVHDGGEAEALLVDVSRSGLGLMLADEAALAVGQGVTVVLGQRRLEGEVVRRHGPQLGLRLSRAIAITDPLFQAG